MIKYTVVYENKKLITFDEAQADQWLVTFGGVKTSEDTSEENTYNSTTAAELSIEKGREIAESMLLELNAKSKEYKQATGLKIGKSLRDSHRSLREALELGDLDDAINEIQTIINSGQVDNFLDVYADALIRIDNFLGAN